MARMTTLILCLLGIPLAALVRQSSPQTPENAYTSRELIAWSQLQIPQPVPQPLPHKDKQTPPPEQPHDQQPKSPSDPHIEQETIPAEKDKVPARPE